MAVGAGAGNTERNIALQNKGREYMPNLRGVSPVGRHGEGHSYVARTIGRGGPGRQRHGH